MKIFERILLVLFIFIIISITSVCIWQWDNINSLITAVRLSDDEIAYRLDTVTSELDKEMTETGLIRPFTAEEIEKMKRGELSENEAVETLISEKNNNSSSQKAKREAVINKYVAKLYVLEAQYDGEINNIVKNMESEFYAYSPYERTAILRDSIIAKNINNLTVMQAECDSKVNSLLNDMESELKQIDSDTAIVKTLKQTYEDKKNLKKAAYIKDYNDN